ncbi:MAG: class I SAM-dependent methyltransferase [Roseburia sp.]|nr:class I SAM-dependent methyltransferase [Roseburia sp.]
MELTEQIGKVVLDYSKYPGEDFYSDGEIEEELLRIARDLSPVEYERVIGESKSWPILYHLSPLRENIVEWLPMKKTAKVLEVGSGCGAITGALARKAGSVTCVELSKKRSMINAYRHSECENVTIHVGNFQDVEPQLTDDFDYICLIGVFEYAQSYIGGDTPFEDFLKCLQPHLKKGGRIVIAIENQYGLKYFAGCKEDHLGTYFGGIENYPQGGGVRTFSRKGLERIFEACGVKEYHFYYPYPDYKFMHSLYSDAYLPSRGELSDNRRNFDRDRMVLFDEKNAFDGLTQDGLFPIFANSYVAVLGRALDINYVKYSNDRAPEYAIKTEIAKPPRGKARVRKYPLTEEAGEHIRNMAVAYENLLKKYEGGRLEINRCKLSEEEGKPYAEFEFVEGTSLAELMNRCLDRDDEKGFAGYFREYVERIGYNSDYPVADFDLIFSNILVQEDTWTLIDYEWTFGKTIATKELAFRAVYYLAREDESRGKLKLDWILEELGITQADAEGYWEQEKDFQRFVAGERVTLSQMRDLIGHRLMTPQNWIERYGDSGDVNRVQIYEDLGEGYQEEASYFVREAYQGDNEIELNLKVSGDVKMLRIDPAMDSCVIKILEMTFNGERVPLEKHKLLLPNGRIMKPADRKAAVYQPSVVFPTTDPNLNIDLEQLERRGENILYVRLKIQRIPLELAEDMFANVKRLI